jgi:RNA-directed DNA polymerase
MVSHNASEGVKPRNFSGLHWAKGLVAWKPVALHAIMRGHFQYYGISGNRRAIVRFRYETKRLVFKWLNRRSQKASFTWEDFEAYLKHYPIPAPRIYHHLYTLSFDS